MAWSPLARDLDKLARSHASEHDYTAGADDQIRVTGRSPGRERIVVLREAVHAVLEDRENPATLVAMALELEADQRDAAEKLAQLPELAAAFEALGDELVYLADLAESGENTLLLGSLANLEGLVETLDALLDQLP